MPLTEKGQKIEANFKNEYGPKEGERIFYAARNKGTITGVDAVDPIRTYLDAARRGDSQGLNDAGLKLTKRG